MEAKPFKSNVYTKTGDKGTSSLYNGERRSKTDVVFQSLGDVDELNSLVGMAVAFLSPDLATLSSFLDEIQCRLLDIGSSIATPVEGTSEEKLKKSQFDAENQAVKTLEQWIDSMDSILPPLKAFILPSGGKAASILHQCRSTCRRAERSTVILLESDLDPQVVVYLNRLSDFFFVAARYVAAKEGETETLYQRADSYQRVPITREMLLAQPQSSPLKQQRNRTDAALLGVGVLLLLALVARNFAKQ